MNGKRRLAAWMAFALVLTCLSACRAAVQADFTPDTGAQSGLNAARTEEPDGEGESMASQTNVEKQTGVFVF